MNKVIRKIKKNRTSKLDIYLSELFFGIYTKKLNNQTYYYNGNDDSLFFVEKECVWMNIDYYIGINKNLYEIEYQNFTFNQFLNERFNLNTKIILTY